MLLAWSVQEAVRTPEGAILRVCSGWRSSTVFRSICWFRWYLFHCHSGPFRLYNLGRVGNRRSAGYAAGEFLLIGWFVCFFHLFRFCLVFVLLWFVLVCVLCYFVGFILHELCSRKSSVVACEDSFIMQAFDVHLLIIIHDCTAFLQLLLNPFGSWFLLRNVQGPLNNTCRIRTACCQVHDRNDKKWINLQTTISMSHVEWSSWLFDGVWCLMSFMVFKIGFMNENRWK